MKLQNKSWKKALIIFITLLLIPVIFVLSQRLEGEAPEIKITKVPEYLGQESLINFLVADHNSGVRRVFVSIIKDGKEKTVFKKSYPRKNFLKAGTVKTKALEIKISPSVLKIKDGKALLRIAVWDHSWRKNRSYFEKNVIVDTTPPEVEIITRNHRIYQGGTGLVIYEVPEIGTVSGVVAGENFFPGYPGYFKKKNIHMSFFALNHKQGTKTKLYLKVTDPAGNERLAGFPYIIIPRPGRKDKIRLSDSFLNWKLPQFQTDKTKPLIDQFLTVNDKIRKDNGMEITTASDTVKNILWEKRFLRLPGSSNRAKFADYRSYYYKGKIVDHQYHLGIDLASYKHAPVPAANSGKIVLVKKIGIYGKTVVIDHGFGLFTSYSHMSSINVKVGNPVMKGEILGRTGITGMTGGDHLHYGMFVNNVFVNPIEWWDAKWIKNNIMSKINNVKSQY